MSDSTSSVRRDQDVTHHAELLAVTKALRQLNCTSLEDCTIYSTAEPCALCCYAIREARIGRVVYGVSAPLTGGVSRWNILADTELSDRLPEVFSPPPEIIGGFMAKQIETTIAARYPLAWDFIRARNIFGGPLPSQLLATAGMRERNSIRNYVYSLLRRYLFDYFGRK